MEFRTGRAALLAGAAVVLLAMPAAAQQHQKPPALGASPGGGETGRGSQAAPAPARPPAAAPAVPPPQAGAGGDASDKFGLPVPATPPAAAAAPQPDKFAAPPAAPGGPGGAPPPAATAPSPPPVAGPPPTVRPQQPPPPAAAAPPPTSPPADEPETVRTLRALLGSEATLRYAGAEVIDPARGAVRLRGVSLTRPDRRLEAAELTLDGLREDGVTEAIARDLTFREGGAGGAEAGAARLERLRIAGLTVRRPPAAGQAPTPDMLSVDTLRLEGLTTQAPASTAGGGGGGTAVAIASLTVEDYGPGRSGRVSLEGLEVRDASAGGGPVDRVSLGRAALRGVDLATLFAALVAKEPPPRASGSYALEADALVLGQGDRRVGSLASLSITGEAPPPGPTGIETGRLALRELRVEPFPGLEEWLRRFGYDALVADLTGEARLDRAAGRLELRSLSLAGREIGALGFSMVLDQVPPGATTAEEMAQARLVSMALRYVDQSLYQRFVRQQARETRQTEQQVRQMLAQQAGALLAAPPGGGGGGAGGKDGAGDAQAMAAIRAAVQRFLRGEAREIEIAARPPQPLPLADVQAGAVGTSPAEVQRALGLTATVR